MYRTLSLVSAAALAIASTAAAQDAGYAHPCDAAPFTDFDFWVGDWVAFDYETGVVQGVDRIEKVNNNCVIQQDWSQMTDRYRAQGAPFRYAGISISTLVGTADGPQWRQVWVGNSGGLIQVQGGLDAAGRMVLESAEFPTQTGQIAKRVWYWAPEEDGTLRSWGEVYVRDSEGEFGEPTIPWNLRYVPRVDAPSLAAAPAQ